MILRTVGMMGALMLLPGCGAGVLIVYDGSRQASAEVIGQILAESTPGIDQDQAAGCVVQALTVREVLALGTGDSTGPSPAYRAKVAEALVRPGVADCLATVPVQGAP
jgi:hypothetical protein